ncbi:MAG: AgrD family cyclic lactone autoinducer peptide [Peptococcaceae bacterium]
MKRNDLFKKLATGFCALSLFFGQLSAQVPCYNMLYQPNFPANAEKLKLR